MPLDDHEGNGAASEETVEAFDIMSDEISAATEQKKKEHVDMFSFENESARYYVASEKFILLINEGVYCFKLKFKLTQFDQHENISSNN